MEFGASMRRSLIKFGLLATAAAWCAWGYSTFAKDRAVSWKAIDDALFRVNDAPVKDWGVYQTGKKRDPLLVQMDKRFLLVKIRDRQIFEIDPARIQHKTDALLWDPSNVPAQALSTSNWDANDTEAVFLIRAKISEEDRLLDIELPHPLDLSGMSPHAASRRR